MYFNQINIIENKSKINLVFKDERLKDSVLLRSQIREVCPFLSLSFKIVKVVLWKISQEKIKQNAFKGERTKIECPCLQMTNYGKS